jgi:predicted amidohydrolase YtcJ
MKGKQVDLILHNGKIHTVDELFSVQEAIAIKDGKIVEVGPERQILNKYSAKEYLDLKGKDVYPGFTDAHGHLLSLIEQKMNLNLTNSKSFEEVIFKVQKYYSKDKRFILGRGWDQSLWSNNEFPTNEKLNALFPNIPVLLIRVDGHAALANDFLLDKAGFNISSTIEGGKLIQKEGKLTGLVLDNAITELMKFIPKYTNQQKIETLIEVQNELFQYGITSVHEAGIEFSDIDLLKSAYKNNGLELEIYAMLYPSEENIQFARKNKKYSYKNLKIQSFKVVGDGSLGSRGACLKQDYHDEPNTKGFLTTSIEQLKYIAKTATLIDYQMNTHAIGDSTNKLLIDVIANRYKSKPDHRWRIEHAQVIDETDFMDFGKYAILPSVQPTHAVSDMRWAKDRLGEKRINGAYAYKKLLDITGIIAFGTDFPVESFNPFLTIHAAVNRKNEMNQPEDGFLPKNKISVQDCIKAMTLWPAFASFQEKTSGSLERGKFATLVVLEYPLNKSEKYAENFSFLTYIKGKKVYSAE